MKIPPQYLPVMRYNIVKNATAFAGFIKAVFNATEQLVVPAENNGILHGELRIYDAVVMFADATDNWTQKPAGMYIYVENVDSVYHNALENGAKSLMLPGKKDYGYTAGFEDPFGNQ